MKLDLSEILSRMGARFPYAVNEPPLVDEELECTTPITGDLLFTNTGNLLLIGGQVKTTVAVACIRCLTYFEERVDVPVNEQFALEVRNVGPRGRQMQVIVEEDENPDAALLFDGHLFDITELLRQGITLAMPTYPLHDEACKGLCPTCGTDLNEGSCGCAEKIVNPTFTQLGTLLEKDVKG